MNFIRDFGFPEAIICVVWIGLIVLIILGIAALIKYLRKK
jgi:hypothetical protein